MLGYIVVITRNGSLGGRYPLNNSECLFGQSPTCDVRVYVPNVARKHCLISGLPNKPAFIRNLSPSNTTLVNGSPIGANQCQLEHMDLITVGDRHFRWEYPFSSRPGNTPKADRKIDEKGDQRSPACMVQVPLSVFKNKRHSSSGVAKENEITSFTSQEGGEPNSKRRKTLDNITDLGVENTLAKPVNKRLLALTQPASSPKSFNTFRVLLKSASKRKSMKIAVSKTPKPAKSVISSKLQRSKSLSSLKNKTPKTMQKKNKASLVKKTLSPKKNQTPMKTSQQNKAQSNKRSLSPLKIKTPRKTQKDSKSPSSKKSLTPFKNKTPKKTPKQSKSPKKKSLSPVKSKTPKRNKQLNKSPSIKKSLSPLKNKSRDNTPKQNKSLSPQKSKSSLKVISPKGMISPHTKDKTPLKRKSSLATPLKSKTPKLSKSPQRKNLSSSKISKVTKSASPRKSGNKSLEISITQKSKSLLKLNTPVLKLKKMNWPLSTNLSQNATSKKNTPDKTPRAKTPSGNLLTPSLRKSTAKSLFSKQYRKSYPMNKTPSNKLRGRTPKSAKVKSSSPRKYSPAKFPSPKRSRFSSPMKIKTPVNKPRKRSPKTEIKDSSKKVSAQLSSPKTLRKSSPVKIMTSEITPRGRPAKSSDLSSASSRKSLSPTNSPSPKTSRNRSPVKNETPVKTRGRPPKPHSPAKSPSSKSSRNSSPDMIRTPAKTARESSPKTETKASSRKSRSPVQSSSSNTVTNSSSEKKQTLLKSFGRSSKSPSSLANSPKSSVNSSTKTPAKTPTGGSPKPEPKVSSRRSRSSDQSLPPNVFENSSLMKETPKRTRGRPSKSASPRKSCTTSSPKPTKASLRNSLSSAQSQSPNTTQNNSLVKNETPAKSQGSPKKTLSPINSPSSPKTTSRTTRNSFYTKNEATPKTPRGRTPKKPVSAKKSFSFERFPSPKTSQISSPDMSPARSRSKTPEADLSIAKAPSQKSSRNNSPMNKTLARTPNNKSPDIKESSPRKPSAEPQSPKTSCSTSPVKTSRGRPATIQAVNEKENLEKSLSSARSPPKTSHITSSPKPTLILHSVTPKSDVRHTRTSILRQSLHHELSLLITESEDTIIISDSARKSDLRNRLSLSRSSGVSVSKDMSSKKAGSTILKSSSKRKPENDFEARAERAAKRLKMETPKSLSKNKVAALLVCHGRSPKSVQKRPLFSEVLKSHLSAAKLRQSTTTTSTALVRKNVKLKPFEPALEVPKAFKFNSTGHANSPETIVITKKIRKTPGPKTRKGRKSETVVNKKDAEQDLEGVSQLFKTPSKSIVSSLKSASSVKKPQSVRVRFSLQNDVQSPSGKRSSVPHAESVGYFGSPTIPPKHYVRTPRPSRFSESSLLHTSIIEESPLAQKIKSPRPSSSGSLRRESSSGVSNQSYDFSAYSPSSPTLQFSQISGVSSETARKSIDFTDFSPISEIDASPKRKRSMPLLDKSLIQTSSTKRISFASTNKSRSESHVAKLQSSPDENARLTESYLFGSTVDESNVSLQSRASRRSHVFQFSPSSSQLSSRSSRSASRLNVSQIPLPPSTSKLRLSGQSVVIKNPCSPEANDSLRTRRSTRSNSIVSSVPETPKTAGSSPTRSKFETLTLSDSKIVFSPKTSPSSVRSGIRSFKSNFESPENDLLVVFDGSQGSKRVSSTPKLPSTPNNSSPVTSPILSSRQQSSVNQSFTDNSCSYMLESLSKTTSPIFNDSQFKTPLPTTGRKSRKSSTRMSASNSVIHTPESQVPIAAVKPSTRKKQGSESVVSDADSISLPNLSGSHDVSGRSMDRNFAQRMLESRASSGFDQQTSRECTTSSGDQSSLPPGSGRRKRKSSASTSTASSSSQSPDVTDFDFNSAMTPKVPREMFVSPLEKVQDDLTDVTGLKQILELKGNSPMSSYLDVKGVKRLLKSPKQGTPVANYTRVEGLKDLFKHSPVADYTNVVGVKRLYGAPSEPNYMNVKGVRRMFKDANTPNSPDLTGVEVLFESPKKIVEEYNQPSTSRPVVMVSPMSRLNSSSKPPRNSGVELEGLDLETVEVEPVQNFSRTNEIPRQTRNMIFQEVNKSAEENIPADSLRTSRSTISNQQVISIKKEESKNLVSKPRGRRNIQKQIEAQVEESAQNHRRGLNNQRETRIEKSQTEVKRKVQAAEKNAMETVDGENLEISQNRRGRAAKRGQTKNKETLNKSMKTDELPLKEVLKKRTRAGKEEMNKVPDLIEQTAGESSEQKKTRGRRKADSLTEVNRSPDLPKRGRGKQVDKIVLEKPKVERKTRGKPNSPTITSLGKRKLVVDSVDDEVIIHSPPKKRDRKGKQQTKVPQDASRSSDYVEQPIVEGSVATSRHGRPRKGSTVNDTSTEIHLEEDKSTTSTRSRGNKNETVPKSPDKVKKQLSPRPISRSRRGQIKNDPPEIVAKPSGNNEIKSPLKLRSKSQKNVQNKKETSHISDGVKQPSNSKINQLNKAVSLSLEKTTSNPPSRSKSRGRRGNAVEMIESPSQEENIDRGKKSGGSNKSVNPTRTAKLNEAIEEGREKESETTTRSRTRRGKTEKSQQSPQVKTKEKGKGEKEEANLTEYDHTAKLNLRLKENVAPEKPSTSQRQSRNKSKPPLVEAKTSKTVKFNMCDRVYSITPSSCRELRSRSVCVTPKKTKDTPKNKATKVVAVKKNIGSKGKPPAKRKSQSPVKSPVAKRVTRARK